MAPKRLIVGENQESSESASVREPKLTGITPDIFMDGNSSLDNLLLPNLLSPHNLNPQPGVVVAHPLLILDMYHPPTKWIHKSTLKW